MGPEFIGVRGRLGLKFIRVTAHRSWGRVRGRFGVEFCRGEGWVWVI